MTDREESKPEEPKAFLHIVHVSDMHVRDGSSPTDLAAERKVQAWVARLQLIAPAKANFVRRLWEEGLAGHDPDAHDQFCDFAESFASDPRFRGVETWLLDTGDLTTMGDDGSLDAATGWLAEFKKLLKAKELFLLYGNHDAWPEKFPFGASAGEIRRHRERMRGGKFAASWPQGPLSADIPNASSKLLLYGVNSAIDDRELNSLALGEVERDPSWETGDTGTDQMVRLAHAVEKGFHDDGKTRDFRILAVHHPVHYPDRPKLWMHMRNDQAVADALIGFDARGRGKLAHLVLSGHTHTTFPALGALPGAAGGTTYWPLSKGQIQLIAGSLTQMPLDEDRGKQPADQYVPQQCQILSFLSEPKSASRKLRVERRIAGRIGDQWGFLTPDGSSRDFESFSIEF
ncbi:MAG: metallophosphoesterase [Burkholderiales bacterium]